DHWSIGGGLAIVGHLATDSGELSKGTRGFAAAPLVALSLVNFVDQLDVSILRGVAPTIQREWGLSDFKLGMLFFAFIFVNSLASVPAGWVADHYRRTRVIGYTLLSWSVLTSFCATAVNFWHLFTARAMLGFGQAIDDPASTSLLGDYYPASQRGRIFSAQQVMNFLGGGIGIGLGGLVATSLGWRWAFVLVGVPGSLIGFWLFKLREPARGEADRIATLGPEAAIEVEASMSVAAHSGPRETVGAFLGRAWHEVVAELRFIFGIRTMRYILVGVSTLLFTVSGVGSWLAIYHQRYSGLSEARSTGVTAGVLAVGGVMGTIWGGTVADRLFSKGPKGRITLVAAGIMACTGLFLASWVIAAVPVRIFLQFLGVIAITSAFPGLRASMMDVIPAESRGLGASAFALTSAIFGTALAPPLVGAISDATNSLVTAFYIVTPPIFIGTFILLRARATIEEDAAAIIQRMIDAHADA
ncbi:MAG: hypothetical protein QOD83_5009, partial [Solirubrobacteraceae bacterium]|nr:hypothetical protein [Solirubrobacteraceae bacterium]